MESQTNHSNPLQPLIVSVDEAAQPLADLEKKVIIDVNRRQAVLSTWFRAVANFKYFLVALGTSGRVAQGQTQVIYLSDLENGRALSLKVNYSAACVPGHEDRVAEALFDGPSPGAVFHALIKNWVHDYISHAPASFINDFFSERESIQAHLSERALAEVGLALEPELSLCGRPPEPVIAVGPISFNVAFQDYEAPYLMRLSAQLSLDGPNNINAFVYDPNGERQDEFTQSIIRRYLASITAQEFFTRFKSGEIDKEIASYLSENLKQLGRVVEEFSLQPETDLPDEFSGIVNEMKYQVFDRQESIGIKSVTRMVCQDYARYLQSGSPAIDSWLSQTIEKVVSEKFFSKKYTEILFDFEALSVELVDTMKSMADKIGYDVDQHLSLANSELADLLESFTVQPAALFETSVDRLPVKLQTTAMVKPKPEGRFREYVGRRQRFQQLIEERIVAEIAMALRCVHPASFYDRFHLASENEPALATVLAAKLNKLLTSEFDCEISSIRFETVDTEFSSWLGKLPGGAPLKLEVKVNSLTDSEPEPMIFQGICKIEAIAPAAWERLHTLQIDLNEIRQQIISNVESTLETRPAVSLTYLDEVEAAKVKGEIEQLIIEYMLSQFGLIVSVNNLRRKLTPLEEERRRKHADLERKRRDAALATELLRIEEIRKLEQYLIKVIASHGAESEITQLRESIEMLKVDEIEGTSLR